MSRKSPRSRRREPVPRLPGKGRPRATPGRKRTGPGPAPARPAGGAGVVAERGSAAGAHVPRGARPAPGRAPRSKPPRLAAKRPVPRAARPAAASLAARTAVLGTILQRLYPDAATPLVHADALQLLVATILSAQCTDARVNLVTPALFERFPDAAALAGADRGELEELIRSTGFYRNKARAIQACCAAIVAQHGGRVPRTMEELTALPGVGRKTANVVLGSAYGIPGIVVDTHVQRLAGRLGLTAERDPVRIEFALQPLVPEVQWSHFSLWLIFHGRRVCVARRPRCSICPLSPHCPRLGVTSAQ
jgi:endonuclease III